MSTLVGHGNDTMPAFLQAHFATEWVLMVPCFQTGLEQLVECCTIDLTQRCSVPIAPVVNEAISRECQYHTSAA